MKNILFPALLCLFGFGIRAQLPDTEIFLSEITRSGDSTFFSKPVNVTNHAGYDNQPSFSPDGERMLYVSMPDKDQTDIYEYHPARKKSFWVAYTRESEYSPAYIPSGKEISIIRVDSDKAQRLYKYNGTPQVVEPVTKKIDSVAYYHFMNENQVALAVLNHGLELWIYNIQTERYTVEDKHIGRCLLTDPKTEDLVYIRKKGDKIELMSRDKKNSKVRSLANGFKNVEDYAFTPWGDLWCGWEGKLYSLSHGKNNWKEIADFSNSCGPFYRLTVSPDGKYLALVKYKGKRP